MVTKVNFRGRTFDMKVALDENRRVVMRSQQTFDDAMIFDEENATPMPLQDPYSEMSFLAINKSDLDYILDCTVIVGDDERLKELLSKYKKLCLG